MMDILHEMTMNRTSSGKFHFENCVMNDFGKDLDNYTFGTEPLKSILLENWVWSPTIHQLNGELKLFINNFLSAK